MNKIKILKGIEKICIAGVIVGAGLLIKAGKMDSSGLIGTGTMLTSAAAGTYTTNKRKSLEIEKYWENRIKEYSKTK